MPANWLTLPTFAVVADNDVEGSGVFAAPYDDMVGDFISGMAVASYHDSSHGVCI